MFSCHTYYLYRKWLSKQYKTLFDYFISILLWLSIIIKELKGGMSEISSSQDQQINPSQQSKCLKEIKKSPKVSAQKPNGPNKKITESKGGKGKKNNHWTVHEQRRYIKFLEQSGHLLQLSFKEKKNKKVNLMMSKKIKTRTASQCHSHHQKMMLTHYSIERIINHFEYLLLNEQTFFKPKKQIECPFEVKIEVVEDYKGAKKEEIGEQPPCYYDECVKSECIDDLFDLPGSEHSSNHMEKCQQKLNDDIFLRDVLEEYYTSTLRFIDQQDGLDLF